MKPRSRSLNLLGATQSAAKMHEYLVPEEHWIKLPRSPSDLLTFTVGALGDLSARENNGQQPEEEHRTSLLFAARYFDAFRASKRGPGLEDYLRLLGAAAYYLCELPGSSQVLVNDIEAESLALDAHGLEHLLHWLLRGSFSPVLVATSGPYAALIQSVCTCLRLFYEKGMSEQELLEPAYRLRMQAYESGTARELLMADAVMAVLRRRYLTSSRLCLPSFTGLPVETWAPTLEKVSFIQELWPAQKRLGEKGVYRGTSAVIQMPTSAGKSRATELVIRSAFLAGRAHLAIIVAPFRALCHELRDRFLTAFRGESVSVNELSDSFQMDFDVAELMNMHGVLVVTPEKLVYVLRHAPELAGRIGLLIYDEGHQFDAGARGVTYELLVASLKASLPEHVQTLLISAVITNAKSIATWLQGERAEVVSGTGLLPTERTVAFASWQDQLGRLTFVEPSDTDKEQYFVPRLIERHTLARRPGEKKERFFPERDDPQSVALFLGLKLASNGGVALFCGRKDTAANTCEHAVEVFDRGLPLDKPSNHSNKDEIKRLSDLYESHLGRDAASTGSAQLGILSHHGSTPHGLRLAVEHAMKMDHARFVVCTSTLAQGVNLPIRYLIVSSVQQGREPIKIRDFHNLIGRAGRSGMHTEGSILFSDPSLYDERNSRKKKWRWSRIQEFLTPERAEPCASSLLAVFDPLESDDRRRKKDINPAQLAREFVRGENWALRMSKQFADRYFSEKEVVDQLNLRGRILAAVESFFMAHLVPDASEWGTNAVELARGTLAFQLAAGSGKEVQNHLIELFKLLGKNVGDRVGDSKRRALFARTLYGVEEAVHTESWVTENALTLSATNTETELLEALWPLLTVRIGNATFTKLRPASVRLEFAGRWIQGDSYALLLDMLAQAKASLGEGKGKRTLTEEYVVELGESALGYDCALALGAVAELVAAILPDETTLVMRIRNLQQKVKFGLPSQTSIVMHELGFADRVIAQALANILGRCSSKRAGRQQLKRHKGSVQNLLAQYPSYFRFIFENTL